MIWVIVAVVSAIIICALIAVACFAWLRPYTSWSTNRLIKKINAIQEGCIASGSRTVRSTTDGDSSNEITCDALCKELMNRTNCGDTRDRPCICSMPDMCVYALSKNNEFLDRHEETCVSPPCDLVKNPSQCSDRYLDNNITATKCSSDYTETQCLAACDHFAQKDMCTNSYCGGLMNECKECALDATTKCSAQQLNQKILGCWSDKTPSCTTAEIDSGCAGLAAKGDFNYPVCANMVCVSLTSDDYYDNRSGCSVTDLVAVLPTHKPCDPDTLPCADICHRINRTGPNEPIDEPDGVGRFDRSYACGVTGCESYTSEEWNCCTSVSLNKCTAEELDRMSTACVLNDGDLGVFTPTFTYANELFALTGSDPRRLFSMFNGEINKFVFTVSINNGVPTEWPITLLDVSNVETTYMIGEFPVETMYVQDAIYRVKLKVRENQIPNIQQTTYRGDGVAVQTDDTNSFPQVADHLSRLVLFKLALSVDTIPVPTSSQISLDGEQLKGFILYVYLNIRQKILDVLVVLDKNFPPVCIPRLFYCKVPVNEFTSTYMCNFKLLPKPETLRFASQLLDM